MSAEQVVQSQIDAYIAGELDRLLEHYAEDIQIFAPPRADAVLASKARLEATFADRFQRYDTRVEVLNRMVLGQTVVDHEGLHGLAQRPIETFVVYAVGDGLIHTAWFFMAE